jgi:hypothetical protein
MSPRGRDRIHTVNIGGRRYRLNARAPLKIAEFYGDCSPPNARRPQIRIARDARGSDFVDTLIHELIHARWWALDEDEVSEFASEIVAILRRFPDDVEEMLEEDHG